jgi:UDP-N-acetylglucosamine 2-epimerase (non-hydrolysing)
MSLKVLTVFGTRPEAIKMAPVVIGLAAEDDIESKVCVTAQHREMLDQVLELFGVVPDYDLDIMTRGQDLFDITAKSLLRLRDILRQECPGLVLVHGDTTTCFTATLAAFYEEIPVGHVEAGLRTGNMRAPFPEEANRALVGRLASYHFAPTENARQNLINEAVPEERIWVTGNTVIDALLMVRDMVDEYPHHYWIGCFGRDIHDRITDPQRKLILITGHRRENFGQGFIDLCNAIRTLAVSHPDWELIYPVHLNPNVRRPVFEILDGLDNVVLIEPLDYAPFVWLMDKSDIVLTDSGGIQEEAPALGKPVLVMREVTERPEAVRVGTVLLVGTDPGKIVSNVERVMSDDSVYEAMSHAHNPYGDGRAVSRITEVITSQVQKIGAAASDGLARAD